jgi:23S rRNA pseudouridine1911/1915/1917 synthase
MRLDLAVARVFGLSRRSAREAVRSGRVELDGAVVEEPGLDVSDDRVARLRFHRDRPARRRVRTRLSVLHEDSAVLIVDKPAGLLTVPTEANEKDTLWARALHYLQHRYGGRPYAGIVHRLDKDTSGAVVFARSRAALHFLQDRFKEHAIDREYVAIARGTVPETGRFDADLARTPGLKRGIARPGQEGRRAVTRYRSVEGLPGATLVSVRPETGRTHQIRVHFAAAGHPILGDRVYGGEAGAAAPRQMLHARRLGFPHPETGEPISAEAPLPEDFADVLEDLRRSPHPRPRSPKERGARTKKNAPARPARSRNRKSEKATRER